ncbi:hypothetical protein I4U23_010876 [Adineta vaga]|nr:hypothetical protein I4U23_010876 [Adineta vaga]
MSSTTCLEQLPAELLLIIFSFMVGNDLINAFANLNSYFNSILHSSFFQLHLFENKNTIDFPHVYIKNIRSLSDIKYTRCAHRFVDLYISQLKHLQSLTINVDHSNNTPITSILPQLTDLEYLNIRFKYMDDSSTILLAIFSLPKLRVCIVNGRRHSLRAISTIDHTPINNSIVRLNIQSRLQTSFFHSILYRLSCLRSLQVTYLTRNTRSLLPENTLPNLKVIIFTDSGIQVSDLDEILEKLPNLELICVGPIRVNENKFEEMLLDQRWMKSFDHIKRIDIEIEWSFFTEGRKEDMRTRLPLSHPGLRGPFHQYFDGSDDEHIFHFYIDFNRNMKTKDKWGMEREIF